ncbi:MAG: AMP-binding protein, partial [Candidatus Limnocylindria bacterium]
MNGRIRRSAGSAVPVSALGIVPPGDLELLAQWNATTVERDERATLVSQFQAAVARHPDRVAVVLGERQLTYTELEAMATRIAHRLVELGAGPGAMVGLLCERSVELVAAVYGIVMARAAYVPLDPEYPADRIGYMVAETEMRVVLGQDRFRDLVTDPGVVVLDINELLDTAAAHAGDGPQLAPVEPDDVAYVIYTSGSTGRPKGVANAHRALVNRMLWTQERFGLMPDDVVLHKTPFSFDVSAWEFFWPLQTGARLVVAAPGGHRDPAYLVETIARHGVDTIHFVPSMLRLFLDHPAADT